MNLLTLVLLAATVALSWPGFTTTRSRVLMLLAVVFLPVVSWCYTVPRGVAAHYRGTRTARTLAAADRDIQRGRDVDWWRRQLVTGTPLERMTAEDLLTYWGESFTAEPETLPPPPKGSGGVVTRRSPQPPAGWVWREDAQHGYSDEQAIPVLDERGRSKVRVAVLPLPAVPLRDELLSPHSDVTIGEALDSVADQFTTTATASDFQLRLALNLTRTLGEAIDRCPPSRETAAAISELLRAARHFRMVLDIRAATGYPPAVVGQPANFDHLH